MKIEIVCKLGTAEVNHSQFHDPTSGIPIPGTLPEIEDVQEWDGVVDKKRMEEVTKGFWKDKNERSKVRLYVNSDTHGYLPPFLNNLILSATKIIIRDKKIKILNEDRDSM